MLAHDSLPKIDTVGRLGGEEFLVILPESDRKAARRVAERFCIAVAEHKFIANHHPIGITTRIGVFAPELKPPTVTVQNVMGAKDKAPYTAKK